MTSLRIRPTRTLAAATALAALSLTACGTKTIDTGEVETTIAKQYGAQGAKVTQVSCKGGVEAKVGTAIDCTALNSAKTTLVIEGKVTAMKGDKGSFQVKTVSAIGSGPVIAARALKSLEAQVGQKARSLVCPARVPIPTTPTVTCELTTLDAMKYDVKLTLDAKADIHLEVADKPKS